MLPIIAIGAHPNANISALCHILSQHGGVFYVDQQMARTYGIGEPRYLLQRMRAPTQLQLHNAILLPGKMQKLDPPVCSGNFTALQLDIGCMPPQCITQHASQLIRCGMRDTDDITIASIGDQQAVLSISRELKSLHGRCIFPGDVVLSCQDSCSATQLLLAGACLLLSDEIDREAVTSFP